MAHLDPGEGSKGQEMTDEVGGEAAAVETTPQAAVEAAVSSQEQASERDWSADATKMGWVPKAEFKGDPNRWRDAEEYVKWGEEFLPFLKADNRDLRAELDSLKKQQTDEIKRMSKLFDGTKKRLEAEYQDRLATLQAKREAAVASGNVAEFKLLDGKIDQLKADAIEEVEDHKPAKSNEDVQAEWVAANPWFEKDDDLTLAAIGYSNSIKRDDLSLEDNLKQTTEFLRKKFPDKFGGKKAAANGHAAVDGGGAFPTAGKQAKGWDDLPSDAKAAGEKFVRDGTFKDKSAYAKAYYEEN
jgi:hypothetical protein